MVWGRAGRGRVSLKQPPGLRAEPGQARREAVRAELPGLGCGRISPYTTASWCPFPAPQRRRAAGITSPPAPDRVTGWLRAVGRWQPEVGLPSGAPAQRAPPQPCPAGPYPSCDLREHRHVTGPCRLGKGRVWEGGEERLEPGGGRLSSGGLVSAGRVGEGLTEGACGRAVAKGKGGDWKREGRLPR